MTQPITWRKSTFSTSTNLCLELAAPTPDAALVRDSKHPDHGHITFAAAELAALLDACRAGDLDALA